MSDGKHGRKWHVTAEERQRTAGLVEKIVADETESVLTRLLAAKVHAAIVSGESKED